ncbi:MAG: manganese efflux pump MntP family protein [Syntrophobacteraceae bacterium]
MNPLETILVALSLGCDAFAVGMGVGARFCSPRQIFRLSFHFGLFQFLMPLVGWFLGQNALGFARQWARWIAFGLLFFIGAKMCYESFHHDERNREEECPDPTRGVSLIALSLATSMDALGVGFSMGILGKGLFVSALWIGIICFIMTWSAMRLGNTLAEKLGRKMEFIGGIILMLIAFKLLMV